MISLGKDLGTRPTVTSGSALSDHYGTLVHWIQSFRSSAGLDARTVGVTSCGAQEGVSTVAANLAIAAAHSCIRPVLLLDLTGSRPRLTKDLAVVGDLGLERALLPGACARECAVTMPLPNLSVLASSDEGSCRGFGPGGGRVIELIRDLEHDFHFIVIDLPPAGSSLSFAIAGAIDGVLLVVEAEKTASDTASRVTQRMAHANANVLGVILNKCPVTL